MIIIIINYYDYQVMFLRQKNFSEAVETLKSFEKQDNKVVEKKERQNKVVEKSKGGQSNYMILEYQTVLEVVLI